jgi:tRNA pseudouridine38-40 synthase
MQRYFIQLSYDGTNYHGWQFQPNGLSVQQVLEQALTIVAREDIAVTGAGRTDAGVHASFFVAHFDAENSTLDAEKITYNLNSLLPADVAVQKIYKVSEQAHARFDALSRKYNYYIVTHKNPFKRQFATKESRIPDLELMNQAARKLFNYIDFTSFSRVGTDVKTNNCKIIHAQWTEQPDGYVFTITADRFLRNMVRAIVGTLLEVGFRKLTIDEFCSIIEAKDRSSAGASVPANGLFLVDIVYPPEMSQGLVRL